MLPLHVFASRQFSAANAVTFVVYAALGGGLFLLPVMLQLVCGYSPLASGAALLPVGMALGIPMPAGIQLLRARDADMVTWAWGMNGALSVVGATVAIFVAMNWGFGVTLVAASATYLVGLRNLLRML